MLPNSKQLFSLLALLFMAVMPVGAQFGFAYLSRYSSYWLEHENADADSVRQLGLKPWRLDKLSPATDMDFVQDQKYYYLVDVKLRKDHLVKIEGDDFVLTLDPLANWSYSHDFGDTTSYRDSILIRRNTRGFVVQGEIGKQVSFRSSFHENQASYAAYIFDYIYNGGVIPGQGRYKNFIKKGFDFGYSSGWVNFRPANWLDLSIGNGKHFIGHGYRSVLLSDAAFNMPYAKATAWLLKDRLQWTYCYAGLQNLERLPRGEVPESLFKRKAMSWQYLSFVPIPRVELGLYSAVIWERWTSVAGTLPFNFQSLNPIPLADAALLGLDGRHNALVGANLRVKASDHLHLYGQFLIDNLSPQRTALQAGFKLISPIKGLDFLAEFNSVDAGSYGNTQPLMAYVHTNQSLAHPSGSGFSEYLGELRYQHKRWISTLRYMAINRSNAFNSNILEALRENETIDPIELPRRTSAHMEFSGAYLLNPKTNLRLELGYINRLDKQAEFARQTHLLTIALKTSIFNEYYDF